jgi:hypothetical protein
MPPQQTRSTCQCRNPACAPSKTQQAGFPNQAAFKKLQITTHTACTQLLAQRSKVGGSTRLHALCASVRTQAYRIAHAVQNSTQSETEHSKAKAETSKQQHAPRNAPLWTKTVAPSTPPPNLNRQAKARRYEPCEALQAPSNKPTHNKHRPTDVLKITTRPYECCPRPPVLTYCCTALLNLTMHMQSLKYHDALHVGTVNLQVCSTALQVRMHIDT